MNTEKPLKLPITLTGLDKELSPEKIQSLEEINLKAKTVKSELKKIEMEKGIASRQLGEAKKNLTPVDRMKEHIKHLSAQANNLKFQLSQLAVEAESIIQPEKTTSPASIAQSPSHINRTNNSAASSKDDIHIIEINDSHEKIWNDFVNQHPESSAYHQYAFRHIIKNSFGHNPLYLAAKNTDGMLVGVLPAIHIKSRIFGNYIVAMPYFNYGSALATDSITESQLIKALNEKAAALTVSHVEYRDVFKRTGLQFKAEKASLILQLPSQIDDLWKNIGSKVRSQIKKADNFQLTFATGKLELLDDFYKVFAKNMRDLGTPVYGKSFFANLLSDDTLNTCIAIAYHKGNAVACGFLLGYRDTMEIPWASTLREANAFNANMFMYWHVLEYAIKKKFQFFDFGRSSIDAGTFKFKQQWGAQPHQLYWHYWLPNDGKLPALNPSNPKYRLSIAVWQRMPVWLTTLLGPHIVKNLP